MVDSPEKLPRPTGIGLANGVGEMNCFVNVAVQALYELLRWAIEDFRTAICKTSCKLHSTANCVLCCLQSIFQKMNLGIKKKQQLVNINPLRLAMATVFGHTGEFEIGSTGDGMEVLATLLRALHAGFVGDKSQGVTDQPTPCKGCPVHTTFHFRLLEDIVCDCGEMQRVQWDDSVFMFPYYVSNVFEGTQDVQSWKLAQVETHEEMMENLENCSVLVFEGRLTELVRSEWETAELPACSSDTCSIKNSKKVYSLEAAGKNFMINLIWPRILPSQLEILQVVSTVPLSLRLDQLFNTTIDTIYELNGIMAFGAGHYVHYGKNLASDWEKFDDERRKCLGEWYNAVEDMMKNQYHPVGLIYQQTQKLKLHHITMEQWFDLEKSVILKQQRYLELATPKRSRGTPLKAEYSLRKTREESIKKQDEGWTCNCGSHNLKSHDICLHGACIKPGVEGWICESCTFLNSMKQTTCRSCKTRQVQEIIPSQERWACPWCCGLNYPDTQICGKCFKAKTNCIDCKAACLDRYCDNCIQRVDHWKCTSCGAKNESVFGVCVKCNKSRVSSMSTYYFSKTQVPTCRCKLCEKEIREPKLCDKCKNSTKDWNCPSCNLRVGYTRRFCYDCIQLLVTCKTCNCLNEPEMPRCYNCNSHSNKADTLPHNSQSPNRGTLSTSVTTYKHKLKK